MGSYSFHPDGNHSSFHPDGNHSSFHPGRNSIRLPPHSTQVGIPSSCRRHSIWLPPLSTRMYHIRKSTSAAIPPGCLTFGTFHPDILHPAHDAGWARRAFQLPRSDISGSADSAYPENFAANFALCRGVLLKLPDRHFKIFFFRYLMSKSPNSPCNPPIIGFLSP